MKVVLSNASSKWGGLHAVTDTLATGLVERGHGVVLFCRPGSILQERLTGRFPLEPIVRGADFNPAAIWRALRALRRHRPDVVVALLDKDLRITGAAARLLRIPVLLRRANDEPPRPHGARLYRMLADGIVTASDATRRTLLAAAPQLADMPFHVIPNSLAPEVPAGEAPWPEGDGVVFLFVGRMEVRKGVYDLLEAWPAVARAFPRARLYCAGSGPLAGDIQQRAAADESMVWLGHRADAAAIMVHADVVVMPSHWEGFGMVAAEAMRAGTAFIGTHASSLPELVEHERTGLLVPPSDPDALADAMIRLGREPALRRSLGEAAREHAVRAFAPGTMAERWEALLRQYA